MSKNKVYSNDPQASRYQKPRTVLDASIEKNKKDSEHYTMREINTDIPPNSPPAHPTKDLEGKRLFDRLRRQEKMYGRYQRKDEREA
jgi:hypothetical protein|tara:strand:- start:493 stop:753 length:261 start_codon:yes stop_codon:yes gene_type:complete